MITIGREPLRAIFPQADDVFDAITVTVQRQDTGARLGNLFRNEQIERKLGIGGRADHDFVPDVGAAIDPLELLRVGRDWFFVEEAEAIR